MLGSFDWTNLGFAGAFIVGCLVGGVAVARVVKMTMEFLRRDDKD